MAASKGAASTFIIASLLIICATAEVSIHVERNVIILPDQHNGQINHFVTLTCLVEPINTTISSRWILPSGEDVTETDMSGRIRVAEGNISTESFSLATLILIQNISYQDAGGYICEINEEQLEGQSCELPLIASIELQLRVGIESLSNDATVLEGDSEVELSCEMTGFLRPDEHLQWFKEDQLINGTGRYVVTYRDGQPQAAQNGGNELVPSRVSVLTISQLQPSDSGVYICRIQGTDQFSTTSLEVPRPAVANTTLPSQAPAPTETPTTQPPAPTETPNTQPPAPTETPGPVEDSDSDNIGAAVAIAVVCTFFLTAVVSITATAVTIYFWTKFHPRTKKGTSHETRNGEHAFAKDAKGEEK